MCFEELWGWIESVSQKEPAKQKCVGTQCLFSNEPTLCPGLLVPSAWGCVPHWGFLASSYQKGRAKFCIQPSHWLNFLTLLLG